MLRCYQRLYRPLHLQFYSQLFLSKSCDCPKNRTGPSCLDVADRSILRGRCAKAFYPSIMECTKSELSCLNNCNKKGTCTGGWCHCQPGRFGADCSLSLGPDGRPQLLADKGYQTREKRPWVYVYELPPHLFTWLNTKRLDRSTHLMFYQRLLGSGARVADGDLADWYYIPIRLRTATDSAFLKYAIEYIREAYPWWNRTGGARHFVIHTGDLGADEVMDDVYGMAANMTWLTHWGLTVDKNTSGWWKAHRPDKARAGARWGTRGGYYTRVSVNRRRGSHMWGPPSPAPHRAGVRQKVHFHHWNRTGFRIVTFERNYGKALVSSKFCLAPLGGGHGQRQIIVSYMGCIPVCIADGVYEPFEPQTDWTEFAVRPAEADIPRLHEILEGISAGNKLAEMQVALRCAAQHLLYSSMVGGLFGEDGRYDAFETTLEVLRVKAAHPDAPPESYRKLDPDFDTFMRCRDPPGWKVSGPVPDMWGMLDGGGGGESGLGAGVGGKGGAVAEQQNPLCSHSIMDRGRLPCERFVQGSSKTHGIPGGIICARSRHNLAKCPRTWL
ncbi:acetylglucosaminyltransferase [Volvox carteri f. nagariensis]|uniref:Acetylglucosaminyltransferase n=1 Tax=Volvox carteri f. nagariensis TaxID=3068 RepID=D8TSL9_VOLCA|nr:acetylglucosaminyltransferase [Volvox carteri f. nagariensis]EFJ49510.1 acetylglucosaminyltransferase [Volvox carteri f. nagariensis]|eukprot:XP_002949491.1 acetylglucosaminyltransferase [Volvox carteri f. nagariensis]